MFKIYEHHHIDETTYRLRVQAVLLVIGLTYSDYSESSSADSYSYSESSGSPPLMIAGFVGLLGSWTWGFVRPHLYDKPLAVQKAANVIDHVNIGLIPANDGLTKVSVSLNYSF